MRGILLTTCAAAAAAAPPISLSLQKVPNFTFLSPPLSIMWTMIYLSGLDPTSLKYIGLGLAD
jgi:hypothetical protein